jgi:hypothetical protein
MVRHRSTEQTRWLPDAARRGALLRRHQWRLKATDKPAPAGRAKFPPRFFEA